MVSVSHKEHIPGSWQKFFTHSSAVDRVVVSDFDLKRLVTAVLDVDCSVGSPCRNEDTMESE